MNKIAFEVVSESEYTNFEEKYEVFGMTGKQMAITAITTAGAITAYGVTQNLKPIFPNQVVSTTPIITPTIEPTIDPLLEPVNVLSQAPNLTPVTFNGGTPDMIQTGFIGDSAMAAFATIFDPIVEIIVAISLPLASVVVAAAGLLLILGNSEKAQSMIIKAGIGYIAVQLLPLFISILEKMGKAV